VLEKEKARSLMQEVRGVLTAVFARHGMVFDMGPLRYDPEAGGVQFQSRAMPKSPGALRRVRTKSGVRATAHRWARKGKE
jgi:hypothetical protein